MTLAGLGRRVLTGAAALFIGAATAQVPMTSAPVPKERLAACGACHGADGNSDIPGIPSLAAQPKVFLEHYLVLTREGIRGSDVMQGLLKGISDREIVALAAHFSALPLHPRPGTLDAALFARGREVADKSHCGSCHVPTYHGQEQMPRLAGQREEFLYEAMVAYRQNKRAGGDTIMAASLYGIADADIKALAHFLAHSK